MPTYSYDCGDCGKEFDVYKTMNEAAPEKCVHCDSINITRNYSKVRINADQGKFDPSSPMYWKKGKSDAHVAAVLNNELPTP